MLGAFLHWLHLQFFDQLFHLMEKTMEIGNEILLIFIHFRSDWSTELKSTRFGFDRERDFYRIIFSKIHLHGDGRSSFIETKISLLMMKKKNWSIVFENIHHFRDFVQKNVKERFVRRRERRIEQNNDPVQESSHMWCFSQ